MIYKLLKYAAKHSHNVKLQVLLACFYGLLSIFGVSGTILILMKARKLTSKPKQRKDAIQTNSHVGTV
jgi:hypothetical protein